MTVTVTLEHVSKTFFDVSQKEANWIVTYLSSNDYGRTGKVVVEVKA